MSDINGSADYSLATLNEDGSVPSTRMRDAAQTQDFARRLRQDDERRSKKRSKVDGLVGGFAPYAISKMRDAGLAQNCNANFGTASSYMENGAGAFYDLVSEAPGFVGVLTDHGTDEQKDEWSRVISEEADRVFASDHIWDWEMQRSQWEMVLHGCGPMFFEDPFKVFPRSVACGDFKVPERTRSDVGYYDACVIEVEYYPPQLFEFIENEQAATQTGWRVEYTKHCIANAMNIQEQRGLGWDWSYYQQQLKANSLEYIDETKIIRVAFVFWKEFDGRISQGIVECESTAAAANTKEQGKNGDGADGGAVQYLFFHRGRYANFREAIAAMYFDRGNGGWHHTVTGLGVKMFSALEFENRLLCRLMDGAFAPKVLFKPTTTEATQKMQLSHMGDYGVMSPGWDAQQMPISGYINEGLAMYRASSDLMRSNLSNYRQQPEAQKPGNPETKFGRQMDAFTQSSLSKTTFNRYYKQLDALYFEIVRRLCNLNSTDQRAIDFQKRCTDRGVMRECFGRIKSVEAIRVVGEGSAFLRKSSLAEMGSLVPGFPEEGQNNWKNDMIAATCGQRSVQRYNPSKKPGKLPSDQQFMALEGIAMMKVGVPPIVTSSQNALTFAAAYLNAGVQALQSVQKGANPAEVLKFLHLCGPAIMAHLKRFEKDPMRQQAFKAISEQLKQLSAATDKLGKMVQQKAQQQKQLQQQQQQQLTDEKLKAEKIKGDLALKKQKQDATLGMQFQKHRQNLAIQDATAASNIHRQNRIAAFSD